MNKQKIVLIASGVVLAALAAASVALLISKNGAASGALEEREAKERELKRLFDSSPFPSAGNIAIVNADTKAVSNFVAQLQEELSAGAIRMTSSSPAFFKQNLESAVLQLRSQAPIVDGTRCVPDGFMFGFGRYLGAEGVMPAQDDVPRLGQQFETIRLMAGMIYDARVSEWKSVERDLFESGAEAEAAEEEDAPRRGGGRRRGRNRGGDEGDSRKRESQTSVVEGGKLIETYSIEVAGRQLAVLDLLNRIAACPTCMVATDVRLSRRVADIRKYVAPATKGGVAAAPVVEASTNNLEFIPKSERVVSGPEIDQLVDARIKIEVIHFQAQPAQEGE